MMELTRRNSDAPPAELRHPHAPSGHHRRPTTDRPRSHPSITPYSKEFKIRGEVIPESFPWRLPRVTQPPPDHRPQAIMIRVDATASGGAPCSGSVGPGASDPRFGL